MKKSDLTKTQLRDLNIFNLILECNGWEDYANAEDKLDRGFNVSPEGIRTTYNDSAILEARFHAPVNMISLRICDLSNQDKVQFHFLYEDKPEFLLEWLSEVGNLISLNNYPELLKNATGTCEMILLEVSDTEIYEVKPPETLRE